MNPGKNASQGDAEPVEVVDDHGHLLAVVSASEVHRQSLPHRAALVLFFSRKGKLVLAKRPADSPSYPGRFDLTAHAHIRPGEAAQDAAGRLAEASFPGLAGPLVFHRLLPPTQSTGFEALTVFRCRLQGEPGHTADSRKPKTLEAFETLEIGSEELAALAVDFRELFAPEVIAAFEGGVLFGNKV